MSIQAKTGFADGKGWQAHGLGGSSRANLGTRLGFIGIHKGSFGPFLALLESELAPSTTQRFNQP